MVRNPPCNAGDLGSISSPGTLFRELRAHVLHGHGQISKKKKFNEGKNTCIRL